MPIPVPHFPLMHWPYLLPIWLAIGCYFTAAIVRALERRRAERPGAARPLLSRNRYQWEDVLWLLGSLLTWVHVALAYAIAHGGSHAEALRHTAEVTQKTFGVSVAAGLYVNFVFAGLWTVDAWGRLWGRHARWPPILRRSIDLFLLFIVFQATVIFGSTPTRWIAAILFATLLALRTSRAAR